MARLRKNGREQRPSPKVLRMSLPDPDTQAFWKATADGGVDEYAARIARFSRTLNKEDDTGKTVRSSPRPQRDTAMSVQRRRTPVLGKLLIMPTRPKRPSR